MSERMQHLFLPSRATDRPFSDALDWLLFGVTLVIGGGFVYYLGRFDLSLVLVDQFSHLSMARQITDSLTPGMSQVGFWPPLLHILLAPLAAFDTLFFSGLAAPLLLVPMLGLALVFLARTLYLLTDHRGVSYIFAALLLLNQYVLYFAATPMMEVLFLTMLFGATYSFTHWYITGELTSIIMTGIFVSLATLARFEGFILLPLVGILILARLYARRRPRTEIEAIAILFGVIATTGLIFTLAYGFVYNDNPLAFMSNNWGAYAQQRDLVLPGEHDIANAVIYMTAAAREMLGGAALAVFTLGLSLLALALVRMRLLAFAVLSILVSPFLFDVLAVFQGSAIVYLPQLPPYPDGYFNARYGLFLAGAVVAVPALVMALFTRTLFDPRLLLPPRALPAFYLLVFLLISAGSLALATKCADCLTVVRNSQQTSPEDHAGAAAALAEHYDGGYILMTRALHNEVAVRAGIPLQNYILEANEHYFDRAVETPWRYARYVVMFNPSEDIHLSWQRENERISLLWAGSDEFLHFYEPIYTSDGEAVYQIKDSALLAHVRQHDLPADRLPSLSKDVVRWNVTKTHEAIEEAMNTWRKKQAPTTPVEVAADDH